MKCLPREHHMGERWKELKREVLKERGQFWFEAFATGCSSWSSSSKEGISRSVCSSSSTATGSSLKSLLTSTSSLSTTKSSSIAITGACGAGRKLILDCFFSLGGFIFGYGCFVLHVLTCLSLLVSFKPERSLSPQCGHTSDILQEYDRMYQCPVMCVRWWTFFCTVFLKEKANL